MISAHSKSEAVLDEREKSLSYLASEVARLFRRRIEVEARALGFTLPQWRVMIEILRNAEITQVALAGCIDADPMTVSGILERLEKRGLIERVPDPKDGRAKLSRLTEAGHELIETARHFGRGLHARVLKGLSEADRDTTVRTLRTIRENLIGMEAEQKETA